MTSGLVSPGLPLNWGPFSGALFFLSKLIGSASANVKATIRATLTGGAFLLPLSAHGVQPCGSEDGQRGAQHDAH